MTVTDNTPAPTLEGEVVPGTEGPATQESTDAPPPAEQADNAVVGEIVKPELSKAEARKLTNQIKKDLNAGADTAEKMNAVMEEAADLMAEAFAKKVWLSLEHASWEDYVASELGEVRVRLERSMRQSLVYRMAQKELSTRAVAAIIGVDQKTVSNDLRQVRREKGEDAPTAVKNRKGQTQKTPKRTPKAKPVAERFTAIIEKLDGPVGDLVSLTVEDGFEAEAGAVAKAHRRDVARLIDSLTGVLNRMQGADKA